MLGFGSLGSLGIFGIALLVVCVVHAIRTNRIFPWIYIIIFLPGIGPLIYIGMEIIPDLVRGRRAQRFGQNLRAIADPTRGLRQAHHDVGLVGSVDAKKSLAEEYMSHGRYADAVAMYRDAAQGQFKDDTALLYGLARAQFATGDAAGTQATLDALQKADPKFASEDAHLLYVRALEGQGKDEEALAEYKKLVRYFAGEEARARYGLLLKKLGHNEEAKAVFEEILRLSDGATSRYRSAQKTWIEIARKG